MYLQPTKCQPSSIEDSLWQAQREGKSLLKKDWQAVAKEALSGNDRLPTGFCKSIIIKIFTLARKEIMSKSTCTVIVLLLKINVIIDYQIAESLNNN